MADNLRAQFGFNASDAKAFKPEIVAGIGAVRSVSFGNDAAPGMHFNTI